MLNAVKDELLDYATFISIIKSMIIKKLGKGYEVEINKLTDNNSPETDILTVLKGGKNFAPNIYLNAYYESYLAGTSMSDILKRLYMIYKHCAIPSINESFECPLDELKSYIFFRLINFERNIRILRKIPYIKFLDLAITFHCLVRGKDDRISTLNITNDHLERWGITTDELLKFAYRNTRRLFPPLLRPMDEVIKEFSENGNRDTEHSETCPMYILTSEKGIYGAFYLLYKDIIRDLARLLNSNLYILPSSIHEIILVPVEVSLKKEYLCRLVLEINESMVSENEILSDNVYIYSLESDKIII